MGVHLQLMVNMVIIQFPGGGEMTKRKKAIIIISVIIALIIASFILILNFLAHGKIVVFRDKSPYDNVEVQIRGGTGFFEFTPMTGFDYEVVVLRKNFIGSSTLLSEEFHYINDGSPLKGEAVDVTWSEDHVTVIVHYYESLRNPKFICYYQSAED